VDRDLALAFHLADVADEVTTEWWGPDGVVSTEKHDGSPVTEADVAVEEALRAALGRACPGDAMLGEEVGGSPGTTGRRWIVDGIDGTRFFAAGLPTWGTLIALEVDGDIVLGMSSSPAQDRRWWATRGSGAFTGRSRDRSDDIRIHVSESDQLLPDRMATLPSHSSLSNDSRRAVDRVAGGPSPDRPWSHQNRVAEGEIDLCIWFCGGIWDHAAPSILVEEAGGRFSDHLGGKRLDTRTAIYSNGLRHDDVLAAFAQQPRA
jgi:histidinol-phosphatase